MTDKEIFDCIEARNEHMLQGMSRLIDGYTSTITTLVTSENDNTRHSINELTKRMDRQNGRVGKSEDRITEIEHWQSEHDGEVAGVRKLSEKRTVNWGKVFNVIMALIGMGALIYTAYNSRESRLTAKTSEMKIDNLGAPVVMNPRGQPVDLPDGFSLKMWPKDFIIDSTKTQ